jgi:hypothetical protein
MAADAPDGRLIGSGRATIGAFCEINSSFALGARMDQLPLRQLWVWARPHKFEAALAKFPNPPFRVSHKNSISYQVIP